MRIWSKSICRPPNIYIYIEVFELAPPPLTTGDFLSWHHATLLANAQASPIRSAPIEKTYSATLNPHPQNKQQTTPEQIKGTKAGTQACLPNSVFTLPVKRFLWLLDTTSTTHGLPKLGENERPPVSYLPDPFHSPIRV